MVTDVERDFSEHLSCRHTGVMSIRKTFFSMYCIYTNQNRRRSIKFCRVSYGSNPPHTYNYWLRTWYVGRRVVLILVKVIKGIPTVSRYYMRPGTLGLKNTTPPAGLTGPLTPRFVQLSLCLLESGVSVSSRQEQSRSSQRSHVHTFSVTYSRVPPVHSDGSIGKIHRSLPLFLSLYKSGSSCRQDTWNRGTL